MLIARIEVWEHQTVIQVHHNFILRIKALFSQDSQTIALVLNGNNILVDVQTGEIIRNVKPLSGYGITLPDDIPYTEKQPIAALGTGFLTQLYRNLPHFRGCDFTDAVLLMDHTKEFLQDFGAEIYDAF